MRLFHLLVVIPFKFSTNSHFIRIFDKTLRIMPEISRFYGIIVYMYINDHNPPHFHFSYGEYDGLMYINDGVFEGKVPSKIITKVSLWLELHKEELLEIWELALNGAALPKVEPLN